MRFVLEDTAGTGVNGAQFGEELLVSGAACLLSALSQQASVIRCRWLGHGDETACHSYCDGEDSRSIL